MQMNESTYVFKQIGKYALRRLIAVQNLGVLNVSKADVIYRESDRLGAKSLRRKVLWTLVSNDEVLEQGGGVKARGGGGATCVLTHQGSVKTISLRNRNFCSTPWENFNFLR